jgi:hypothetical protein
MITQMSSPQPSQSGGIVGQEAPEIVLPNPEGKTSPYLH